ncbi:replicative DNA helicase [Nakamurella sp. UYEF19]|uniref:replicative DNA helicase n=1 Tax=Nakamurella sp. UYEF19 TaxID=1756392 RepID=UPI003394B6D4
MAVIDDRWAAAPSSEPPRQFDRQPPQDLAAEQSVLGGMLLSKDAIADVVEELSTGDFYKPAHATVYDVILNLYARGEPADVVTVAAELDKAGTLSRIGGAVYLHTLTSAVPTAANAAFYAQIVAEKAVLRRLVEAGTRIVQLGYGGNEGQVGGGEVDEIVDRAQAEIYEVTERRTTEDYVVLEELLQPTMDEMDAIASRGGMSNGVPTGFADLDALTNGFHPGQMIIMAARPGVGKALALHTPLPTPTGWTTMGEVQVGDLLLGADGRPVPVVAATEVMEDRPCYAVTFSDGEVIVADAEHQWLTETRASRRSAQQAATGDNHHQSQRTFGEVLTTKDIRNTLRCHPADARLNHSVATAAPLELPEADLPIPPYALGVWLEAGDSDSARFSGLDVEIGINIENDGLPVVQQGERDYSIDSIQARLRALGLLNDKHIPMSYLRASEAQRRLLLAGLLDTDGTVSPGGEVQFGVTNPTLAADAYELIVSLGYRCSVITKQVSGSTAESSSLYTLNFSTSDELFRLQRKLLVHKECARTLSDARRRIRYIVDVAPVASVPVRCVQIDNADRLYLAGRSMVPTHNSTLALDVARNASVKHRLTSVIFSLEMSKTEITMRLLSAEAQIRLSQMRAGTMSEQDWQKIVRRMSEISDAPLFIDDSPNMTMMEIRAKARRLKQRNNLKLIVLDYLQLMSSGKKVESRQQEVSEFSRQMKLLAKELEVPVIAISQLNRGPEQRTDKRPMLSDLRESGSLEQDADMVILVHRPDAFEADDPRAGEADLIIAKHRNGPTTTISVAHQLHYSRFTDLAAQ